MNTIRKKLTTLLTATILLANISSVFAATDSGTYTGYVLYAGEVITEINGIRQQTPGAVITDMDGTEHTIATGYEKELLFNNVVSVKESEFWTTLMPLQNRYTLSGIVNAQNMTIGSFPVSENVKILDFAPMNVSSSRPYSVIDMERIDGLTINTTDVIHLKKDADGLITELILSNLTGDAFSYGITKHDNNLKENIVFSNGKKWISDISTLKPPKFQVGVKFVPALKYCIDTEKFEGGLIAYDDSNYLYRSPSELKAYPTTSTIQNNKAIIAGNEYKLSDTVQVFYCNDNNIVQTSLESVSNGKYKLTCYYDKKEEQGGRIRVILAKNK